MSVKTILLDEFVDEVAELGKMEVGSAQYKIAVDGIKELYDMMSDQDKIQFEQELRQTEEEAKRERRCEEEKFKKNQLKKEFVEKMIDVVLKSLEIGLPLIVTVWGTIIVLDFEKEDIVGSFFSKSWLQKLVIKK